MTAQKAKTDQHVEQILEVLRQKYLPEHPKARIDAYRYDVGCIRVRILDPDYTGTRMEQRWKQLYKLLESLPQETRSEISLMFLMTPREAANRYKHMNWEYENPEPTPDPTDRNGEPGPENTRPTRARKRATAKRTGRSAAPKT